MKRPRRPAITRLPGTTASKSTRGPQSTAERLRRPAGAFYEDEALVFAANAERVGEAIDVLAGKSPGITDSSSPLYGRVPGATVIARAAEIPDKASCPALKQVKSFRVAMGENEGKSFFRERIVMKSPEAANQVKTIGEGFKALISLQHGSDGDVMKLLGGLNSTVCENTVTVRWEAPVEDTWKMIEKIATKAEAHIKKMKERHAGHGDEGKKHEGEKHEQEARGLERTAIGSLILSNRPRRDCRA